MLRTRLWMGALLILLTLGVLLLDNQLAPYYPCLFLFALGLAGAACHELLSLLGPTRRPWPWLCYLALFVVLSLNWVAHLWPALVLGADPLHCLLVALTILVLVALVVAMAEYSARGAEPAETVNAPSDTLSRVALSVFLMLYLGVLPSFLVQLRWAEGSGEIDAACYATLALALTIFVPKCCDIGAYTAGRLFGKHKMTPVLSPKKTWEGLAGGLIVGVSVACTLHAVGPVFAGGYLFAVGFGLSVSMAGVLGDLAESLIKRECRQKDASQAVPGFGGVLDVVDSILFAAPVAYLWLG